MKNSPLSFGTGFYSSFSCPHEAYIFGLNYLHQQCLSPRGRKELLIYPSPAPHNLIAQHDHWLPQPNKEGGFLTADISL